MADIKETRELIAGVAAGIIRVRAGLVDDKKLSWFELAGFVGDIGIYNRAISGISEVPREFIDLTELEYQQLRADVIELLVKAGLSHRSADVTDRILKAAYDIVVATLSGYTDISSLPPSAILVE